MFLVIRSFYNDVNASEERDLPLDAPEVDVSLRDSIPLGGAMPSCLRPQAQGCLELEPDIIACNVVTKNRSGRPVRQRLFLSVDPWRLKLLEPSSQNPNHGIVRYGGRHPPAPRSMNPSWC